jgi:hypothetical protein
MKSMIKTLAVFLVVLGLGFIFVKYYSYIFSEKIEGVVERVERVQLNVSLMSDTTMINPSLYSFAVGIKTKSGEIKTSSAEDRQWAVVEKGKCAEARFYPYPPWNFDKSGTYFNARLIKYFDCPIDPASE